LSGASRSPIAVGLLALGAACSATRFDRDPCTAHSQCRASFGFGAICQSDGFCGSPALPRCDRAYPEDLLSDGARYREAIVLASLTDRSSPAQLVRERAIRLAVKEANAGGGLEERPLGVVQCDIQPDPGARAPAETPPSPQSGGDGRPRNQAAVETARQLAATLGVPAILGPATSAEAQAVWEAVGPVGSLVISPSATSHALAALEQGATDEQPGLLWTVALPDRLQAQVIADDLLARQVGRVHLLRETGLYGEGLASLIADRFRQGGGTLQVESLPSEAHIAAAAASIPADDEAEVVFISSQPRWIIEFLRQASGQPGFASRNIFLTDAAADQAVLDGAAEAAGLFPRIRGTRPAPLDPSEYVYASFAAGYRAEYGGQDPAAATYSAHAYDAAWLALYGAAWSAQHLGAVSGPGMARGLRHLGAGEPTPVLPSSWKGALAALRAGRSLDLRGASGDLAYDLATRAPRGSIEIWGVAAENGRFSMTSLEVKETTDLPKETP
jgi:branched-chain amino acid transport system substrate-binding protein